MTGGGRVEPGDLNAWLRTGWMGRSSTYHEVIGSTQDEALRLAAAGAPHGYLVWAGQQTAGRGRMKRQWQSPPTGLWFSVILRPHVEARRLAALPLAVGAAVASGLEAFVPGQVRLKWPNDVLLDGRKLAGILVDGQAVDGVLAQAVVGVGVNLARPDEGFAGDVEGSAATLEEAMAVAPSPTRVLGGLLTAMEAAYEDLLAHGAASARARWLELADTIGRDVVARAGGAEVRGQAVDLDEDGNLVLLVGDEPRVIGYGEVEHLR